MFKNAGSRILPELMFLITRALPLAAFVFSPLFVLFIYFKGITAFKSTQELWIHAFVISFIGIYMARLTAYIVKRNITNKSIVQPDIYFEEEN